MENLYKELLEIERRWHAKDSHELRKLKSGYSIEAAARCIEKRLKQYEKAEPAAYLKFREFANYVNYLSESVVFDSLVWWDRIGHPTPGEILASG